MKVQGPEQKPLPHGAAPVLFTSQEIVTKKQVMRFVKEDVNRKFGKGKWRDAKWKNRQGRR